MSLDLDDVDFNLDFGILDVGRPRIDFGFRVPESEITMREVDQSSDLDSFLGQDLPWMTSEDVINEPWRINENPEDVNAPNALEAPQPDDFNIPPGGL